jgi:hypothetical protein
MITFSIFGLPSSMEDVENEGTSARTSQDSFPLRNLPFTHRKEGLAHLPGQSLINNRINLKFTPEIKRNLFHLLCGAFRAPAFRRGRSLAAFLASTPNQLQRVDARGRKKRKDLAE